MKKIIQTTAMRRFLSVLLAAAMVAGTVSVQGVQAAARSSTAEAAYIQKLEEAPGVDMEKYADSSVMFRLSDNIREDEEISVIITVDVPNLMDAYEGTDKTMSFTDFATESEEAAAVEARIAKEKARILAAQASGKLKISKDQTSGPFISGFSSWGPTPSLEIKPEITAHGGNILSSVTGGGYDRLSGTSMACPNLASVVLMMRQYVMENFPDIANDDVAVNAMVNRLMMSTADIIINTTACIITKDEDGRQMDKTKLELGDDPETEGVYTMSFSVDNFGDKNLTYELGSYVMTEGVSDTKTSDGETTVTEEAYILSGAALTIDSVEGGKLTVTITLSDEDKAYLDTSFANGMYVEGFITPDRFQGHQHRHERTVPGFLRRLAEGSSV